MKLLILSDTHGNYPLAISVIEQACHADRIIHLGDNIEDARMIEMITGRTLIKVAGNCDPPSDDAREIIEEFAGRTFLMAHGDRYQVKSGLTSIARRARQSRARIVLYGHTHIPSIEVHNEILFINPGCLNRSSHHTGYALLTIEGDRMSAQLFPVTP